MKNLNDLTKRDKKEIMEKVYQTFKSRTEDRNNVMNVDPSQRCTHTELRNYIAEQGYDSSPVESYPAFTGYIKKCQARLKREEHGYRYSLDRKISHQFRF